jgi:hypothetical protein
MRTDKHGFSKRHRPDEIGLADRFVFPKIAFGFFIRVHPCPSVVEKLFPSASLFPSFPSVKSHIRPAMAGSVA